MKVKKQFSCSSCGAICNKWTGQCFDCNAWGTIEEELLEDNKIRASSTGVAQKLEQLDDKAIEKSRIPTSIEELNRVLGGGLVAASAILIGGDPGIGKSTLLLQLSASLSSSNIKCLYVTGEESTEQIKLRAKRLNIGKNEARILAASNVEDIISTIEENEFDLIIIDSIQTIYSRAIASAAGTVSQIRTSANELISYGKKNNIIMILACHVTKDGQLAGPKILEHMVDTVLYFEGDQNNHFRILRSIKNRFGAINEIGVFEMTDHGLNEVLNPSELFLADRDDNVSGSAIFAAIEGSRPLLIEVQALISPSNMPMPRRSVVGWDLSRLSMILAVLNVRFGLNLSSHEVYLTIAGGIKIYEPAADLAVVAALVSAAKNKPVPKNTIFFGEISLSGEVRKVSQSPTRIKEAKKLGFKQVICAGNEDNSMVKNISHIADIKRIIN